jgi:hypothetical protein
MGCIRDINGFYMWERITSKLLAEFRKNNTEIGCKMKNIKAGEMKPGHYGTYYACG